MPSNRFSSYRKSSQAIQRARKLQSDAYHANKNSDATSRLLTSDPIVNPGRNGNQGNYQRQQQQQQQSSNVVHILDDVDEMDDEFLDELDRLIEGNAAAQTSTAQQQQENHQPATLNNYNSNNNNTSNGSKKNTSAVVSLIDDDSDNDEVVLVQQPVKAKVKQKKSPIVPSLPPQRKRTPERSTVDSRKRKRTVSASPSKRKKKRQSPVHDSVQAVPDIQKSSNGIKKSPMMSHSASSHHVNNAKRRATPSPSFSPSPPSRAVTRNHSALEKNLPQKPQTNTKTSKYPPVDIPEGVPSVASLLIEMISPWESFNYFSLGLARSSGPPLLPKTTERKKRKKNSSSDSVKPSKSPSKQKTAKSSASDSPHPSKELSVPSNATSSDSLTKKNRASNNSKLGKHSKPSPSPKRKKSKDKKKSPRPAIIPQPTTPYTKKKVKKVSSKKSSLLKSKKSPKPQKKMKSSHTSKQKTPTKKGRRTLGIIPGHQKRRLEENRDKTPEHEWSGDEDSEFDDAVEYFATPDKEPTQGDSLHTDDEEEYDTENDSAGSLDEFIAGDEADRQGHEEFIPSHETSFVTEDEEELDLEEEALSEE